MDLPDIKLIVQWRAPTSISTLWQRFGRCVRNTSLYGTAVLLAEKEHFNHLKNVKKKRKRTVRIKPEPNSTVKRTKLWPLSDQSINRASQVDEGVMDDGEEGDGDQEDADDEQDDDDDDDEKRDEKSKKSMKKFNLK
jgi:superfamily II DNA/RNA helicase